MKRRTIIQWTETAKEGLRKVPLKTRAGIVAKADELAECEEPEKAHKRLRGPLQGYFRLTCGRYRAIYMIEEESLANDDVLVHIRILFVAVGIRKEHDKKDVYRVAKRLVDLGLLNVSGSDLSEDVNAD